MRGTRDRAVSCARNAAGTGGDGSRARLVVFTGNEQRAAAIKARGQVICGVHTGLAGFSAADSTGKWNGLSGYLSRSKQGSDQWRGPGTFDREHWEAKLRYELSPAASVSFSYVTNDYFDYDSPVISKAQYYGTAGDLFGRSGRYFGYLGYVPDLPVTTPGITYSNAAYNQYYLQAINSRNDSLYTGNATFYGNNLLEQSHYFSDGNGDADADVELHGDAHSE